ncbi:DUF3857 and transglutaminase domain-containing protein [Spirosoma sp. RP8]|uniref:DUF3857 and transglutaminase domain-containing protein n=1 Tax=Spirosoma liriopis TaxID=2937440 RepID=A0ABT0HF30_9BACT|nr:DUF3857 domain-containing protein [Spirosoma liriopis]MCK8490764.1 DUF3857 and transglutaminase domain-containing protein [Spirosoma liriopis]
MKKTLLLILVMSRMAAGQSEYQASTLPPALKENAHAVIRRHETVFSVESAGEATQRIRSVVTVLDEQGDGHSRMVVGYDKLSKVVNLEGALYDATGKLIKKLKKPDINDYSTYTDYNLFDDNRVKSASFPKQPAYPYTVEFVVETLERNLMFCPTWMPQDDEYVSVEQASFTVNMPAGLALRYKEMNIAAPRKEESLINGGKAYVWTLTNSPAVELEPLSPPAREQLPIVYTAPTDFEVQSYKGTITSWSDLGRFYYNLNQGRDRIPDDLRQRVIDLTKTETTTAGKVRKVYQFLQEQTRYVSIQLGIGGWQTIEAEKVAVGKYGDCKALTNYAQALLKAAGVTAYPALARAGDKEPDLQANFPSFQFNHVILCVPNEKDTLFLECTSSHDPAGYVGDFTGNRHVLLVLPEGSRLVKTPMYRAMDNCQQRRATVTVNEEGDASVDLVTCYTGFQQDDHVNAIHSLNPEDQRSWLLKRIAIPAFELDSFSFRKQTGAIPSVTERLGLSIRRWANASGTRLFLPLNLMSALSPATPLTQPRQTPVELGPAYDFDDSDTITYQLPRGYKPEYQIEPLTIESKFGTYQAKLVMDGERVVYIRRITMHRGRFPAPAYAEWVDFRKKIAKADRTQLVFVKRS